MDFIMDKKPLLFLFVFLSFFSGVTGAATYPDRPAAYSGCTAAIQICTSTSARPYASCVQLSSSSKYYKVWIGGTYNYYSTSASCGPTHDWSVTCTKVAQVYDDSTHTCKDPVCTSPQINDAITGACIDPPLPTCVSPQINDAITGVCITPYPDKPTCVIPQDPLTADCKWPDDKGTGMNCMDGSTVYVPEVCPANFWDRYKTPGPGQSSTCPDGSVASPGQSCFVKYLFELGDSLTNWNQERTPQWYEAYTSKLFFGTSTLTGISPVGPYAPLSPSSLSGSPSLLKATFPMQVINSGGIPYSFNVSSTVPKDALGIALQKYFQASPTSDYTTKFTQGANDAGFPISFNSNTGNFTPSGSTVPLSSNQLADVATKLTFGFQSSVSHPIAVAPLQLPLNDLVPFVSADNLPWVKPGIQALQNDFTAVMNPSGASQPLNFPQVSATPTSTISLAPVTTTTPSLVDFTSTSPIDYVQPVSNPTTLPDPSVNTNPLSTDAQTSPMTNPAPGGPLEPTTPETVPDSPDIYPDTYKYLDFLPTANPFTFELADMWPTMPELTCSYEIHQVIQVPFMGPKNFDVAPCVPLQPLRDVLQWAFSILTIITCATIVLRAEL